MAFFVVLALGDRLAVLRAVFLAVLTFGDRLAVFFAVFLPGLFFVVAISFGSSIWSGVHKYGFVHLVPSGAQ